MNVCVYGSDAGSRVRGADSQVLVRVVTDPEPCVHGRARESDREDRERRPVVRDPHQRLHDRGDRGVRAGATDRILRGHVDPQAIAEGRRARRRRSCRLRRRWSRTTRRPRHSAATRRRSRSACPTSSPRSP